MDSTALGHWSWKAGYIILSGVIVTTGLIVVTAGFLIKCHPCLEML